MIGQDVFVGATNALTLLHLLEVARDEVWKDTDRAQNIIVRVSTLLRAEIDRTQLDNSAQSAQGGLPPWRVNRLKAYIDEHLDQPVRLSTLSTIANLSVTHFSRAFKKSLGETAHAYIVRRRLEQARHLMITTEESLSDIALACGFSDQAHFTKSFRQSLKQSPGAWRRERRSTGDISLGKTPAVRSTVDRFDVMGPEGRSISG
jgi:AraC family transcriptional regulator